MTREEAIKIIDCYDIGFYDLSGAKIPADKLADAFDMAIETLEQEPSVRCKDCKHIELKDFVNGTCKYRTGKVTPDGFCERGEKR